MNATQLNFLTDNMCIMSSMGNWGGRAKNEKTKNSKFHHLRNIGYSKKSFVNIFNKPSKFLLHNFNTLYFLNDEISNFSFLSF